MARQATGVPDGATTELSVVRVAADPSRPQVAGAYGDGTVFVGGVVKGEAAFVRTPDGDPVTALAYTAHGLLLAGTRAGQIAALSLARTVS